MPLMPVIVVGADTPVGGAIVDALLPNAVEVRAFISDESRVTEFKTRGTKVAVGDVSDSSHVEGAATRCFCAVLVVGAATDGRTLSFSTQIETTLGGWATALQNSKVKRAIWVVSDPGSVDIPGSVNEVAVVALDDDLQEVAMAVARLEDVAHI